MGERKTWTLADVVDVSGPSALLRNYLEQRDVREYLQRAELSWYEARLAPLRLIRMGPREIEPGYPRADVGTYMLFGPA